MFCSAAYCILEKKSQHRKSLRNVILEFLLSNNLPGQGSSCCLAYTPLAAAVQGVGGGVMLAAALMCEPSVAQGCPFTYPLGFRT